MMVMFLGFMLLIVVEVRCMIVLICLVDRVEFFEVLMNIEVVVLMVLEMNMFFLGIVSCIDVVVMFLIEEIVVVSLFLMVCLYVMDCWNLEVVMFMLFSSEYLLELVLGRLVDVVVRCWLYMFFFGISMVVLLFVSL